MPSQTALVLDVCIFGLLVGFSWSFSSEYRPTKGLPSSPLLRLATDNSNFDPIGDNDDDDVTAVKNGTLTAPICRIVSRADSRLPSSASALPQSLNQNRYLLDALFHAKAHRRTQTLKYLDPATKRKPEEPLSDADKRDEEELVQVSRNALENAGFELLSRRDLDLCESLNAGYLLRLSILPDTADLDPNIAREFYPERFHKNGTAIHGDEILFDGRVLVYWRGYSEEVSRGRLILPKLDYLQASLVQRSAAWVTKGLDKVEIRLGKSIVKQSRLFQKRLQQIVVNLADSVPVKKVAQIIREFFLDESSMEGIMLTEEDLQPGRRVKLGRYGGSKVRFVGSPNPSDALDPFTICEVDENGTGQRDSRLSSINDTIAKVESDLYEEVNHYAFTCEYDAKMSKNNPGQKLPKMRLLERVSISDLVDVFTEAGRRKLVSTIFEKSKLVEPTYEEVVVVWRPRIKPKQVFAPPRVISEFADMFDIEGFEQPPGRNTEPPLGNLEIRNFEEIPMSNLPAVLPKTKLIFRPADAFLFDMISFVTLALVVSSIRLDSPRLDLLAFISVILWTFRTVIRYSNKLARYDLLVKKFLTSKISHRNAGALKYLTSEAGSQRAIRSALVHSWVSSRFSLPRNLAPPNGFTTMKNLTRSNLREIGEDEVNQLLHANKEVKVDIGSTLEDLEELRLVSFYDDDVLKDVKAPVDSAETIKESWVALLDSIDEQKQNDFTSESLPQSGQMPPGKDDMNGAPISLKQLAETRKSLSSTLKAAQSGYTKAKQFLPDADKLSSLRASFENKKDKD